MINVREYNSNDLEKICVIIKQSFNKETTKEQLENNLSNNNIKCFVITKDEIVVGSLFLTYIKDIVTSEIQTKVDYVCIDENYRNQGLGKILVEHVINNEKDVDLFFLTSSKRRPYARKIYSSIGFTIKDTDLFIKNRG